jgi:hypothetical protein
MCFSWKLELDKKLSCEVSRLTYLAKFNNIIKKIIHAFNTFLKI